MVFSEDRFIEAGRFLHRRGFGQLQTQLLVVPLVVVAGPLLAPGSLARPWRERSWPLQRPLPLRKRTRTVACLAAGQQLCSPSQLPRPLGWVVSFSYLSGVSKKVYNSFFLLSNMIEIFFIHFMS